MTTNFQPLPLLGGPHVQTVLGVLLNYWQPGLSCRQWQVRLPDGDRLQLYDSQPAGWQPGQPILLLVHGLTGCHRSGYLVRLGRLLLRHNYRVVRLDLRGAGHSIRFARRTYTAACSDDVRAAAEEVRRWSPASPLMLAGFSLGGNIVLKLAAEAAEQPLPGLAGVAAVNPPIDLAAASTLLDRPENQFYNHYFARALIKQLLRQRLFFPDLPEVNFPDRLTLRDFDELFTAPCWGFASATDYYQRASALPLMAKIAVPTLILTAEDDPFVPAAPIAALPRREDLEVCIVPRGGHLGFIGFNGQGSIRWAEQQVANWIVRLLGGI